MNARDWEEQAEPTEWEDEVGEGADGVEGDGEDFLSGLDDRGSRWEWFRRRRRILMVAGLVGILAGVVLLLFMTVFSGSGDEGLAEADQGQSPAIEFGISDGPVSPDGVGGAGSVVVAGGIGVEGSDVSGQNGQVGIAPTSEAFSAPWMLSAGSTDATSLQPWAQSGSNLDQVPLVSEVGAESRSAPLSLVSASYLYRLGPPVWHMVRAEIAMRMVASQSLTTWDYEWTRVRLRDIKEQLRWVDDQFEELESPEAVSHRVEKYSESVMDGVDFLDEALDILEEVNQAYGDDEGWDDFTSGQRERVSRLVTQTFYAEVDAFGALMGTYGCSICGELYRNPGQVE